MRGILPDDLFDIVSIHGLHFSHRTESGVLYHMIGALSQFGKLGLTAIGNDAAEVEEVYAQAIRAECTLPRPRKLRGRRPGRCTPDALGRVSSDALEIRPHLVLPVRPVVATFGAPVVEMMTDALEREQVRQVIRVLRLLPGAGAGDDVDVARVEQADHAGVVQPSEVSIGLLK